MKTFSFIWLIVLHFIISSLTVDADSPALNSLEVVVNSVMTTYYFGQSTIELRNTNVSSILHEAALQITNNSSDYLNGELNGPLYWILLSSFIIPIKDLPDLSILWAAFLFRSSLERLSLQDPSNLQLIVVMGSLDSILLNQNLTTDPQTTFFASALQEATVNAIESCKKILQQILDVELPYVNPGRENITKAIIILDLAIQNAAPTAHVTTTEETTTETPITETLIMTTSLPGKAKTTIVTKTQPTTTKTTTKTTKKTIKAPVVCPKCIFKGKTIVWTKISKKTNGTCPKGKAKKTFSGKCCCV